MWPRNRANNTDRCQNIGSFRRIVSSSSASSNPQLAIFLVSFLFFFISHSSIVEARIRRDLPLSMDKEMFPAQHFDEEAPICLAEREPCGFYSFSLDGKAPLKWIKSWCRCSAKHECVYERTDLRMRVYRQTCLPKGDTGMDVEEEGEELTAGDEQEQRIILVQEVEEKGQNKKEEQELMAITIPAPKHNRHHHHHHHRSRHIRKANRRIVRRLRAITLVD